MASVPKKPSTPSNNRRQNPASTSGTAASEAKNAKMAASTPAGTPSSVSRTRSVRNGAPLSARAAARSATDSDAAITEATAALQAQLDEMREKMQQAEEAGEESRKQATLLQSKLDDAQKEQGLLEEHVHEHTQRIEELENEKKENVRSRRELEQTHESERAATQKEKEESQAREEELQSSVKRMKESLAQREMRAGLDEDRRRSMSRTGSSRSAAPSPNPDGNNGFAPPSSIQRSDSRSSSKLVMAKDKIIESLRMELAEAQIKLVEMENMGGGQLQELQKQVYETKIQNARLMEENESFQLLLSEKTLNGDLAHSDLLRPPSTSGSRPSSSAEQGKNLADELASHSDGEGGDGDRKLQGEVNSLKDQNKALTLYINNIISRLLQHEQFEAILDQTPDLMAGPGAISRKFAGMNTEKELPPPPPSKDENEEPAGFLQRAKSVMGGGMKPRPTTGQQPNEPTLTENPNTAPSIPLGRSASTRGGHRRVHSEWSAASVVTNMYRGPSPGLQGPVSPGLSSPGKRNPFFTNPQPLSVGSNPNQRVPSAPAQIGAVPEEGEATPKENARNRTSMISNPSQNLDVEGQQESGVSDMSNPSTPPRSTTSSGDRDPRAGGAVMMGTKMRPLRLVQGAEEQDSPKKNANNRASWFGWMNKGGAAPPSFNLGGKPGGEGSGV